jgi:hypothetical protein
MTYLVKSTHVLQRLRVEGLRVLPTGRNVTRRGDPARQRLLIDDDGGPARLIDGRLVRVVGAAPIITRLGRLKSHPSEG